MKMFDDIKPITYTISSAGRKQQSSQTVPLLFKFLRSVYVSMARLTLSTWATTNRLQFESKNFTREVF